MKKVITLLLLVGLPITFNQGVMAQEMDELSVDDIVEKIMIEQDVNSRAEIDVSTVSLEQLEELGDAVMGEIIGNKAMHERMDRQLGGEGSANLTDVHTNIGYDYLMGYPINMMTFMGGNMMRYNNYWGYDRMMGGYYWPWFIVGVILFILLVAIVIYAIARSKEVNRRHPAESGLEIAKKRLAKGEITKEEYDSIVERLK